MLAKRKKVFENLKRGIEEPEAGALSSSRQLGVLYHLGNTPCTEKLSRIRSQVRAARWVYQRFRSSRKAAFAAELQEHEEQVSDGYVESSLQNSQSENQVSHGALFDSERGWNLDHGLARLRNLSGTYHLEIGDEPGIP